MKKYLMIWPKSKEIVHINYHYSQFGEIIDYLNKKVNGKIYILDQDIDYNTKPLELIANNKIEKVIMMVNYENCVNAFELAKAIKDIKNDIPIFAYGPLTITLPNLFLSSPFNIIHSNGDCEIAIETFIKYYKNNMKDNLKRLKGSKIVSFGRFYNTLKGEYISNEEWGLSKESIVPIKEYDNIKGKNRFVLNISRGCPFACEHCLIQLTEGRIERRRSIKNLKESIDVISKQYSHIKLWAANFTLNKGYVIEFCNIIRESYKNITWECATRIDLLEDEELLKLMSYSGCKQISIGVESLRNKDLIHTKDFNKEKIINAIKNIKNAGMKCKCCIMIGMPGQTREDIIEIFDFLNSNGATIRPTIYTPYHLLNEKNTLAEIVNYNRKTYKAININGVDYMQLLELIKNPTNYLEILNN